MSGAKISGRDRLIVQLDEVKSRTEAEGIPRGTTLDIHENDVIPLPDGAYYRFQLIGLDVVADPERTPIGTVEDIIETGVNDVLIVRAEGRPDTLIPNTEEIVTVDLQAGVILVHSVEGLLPQQEEQGQAEQQPQQERRRRRRRRR